MKKLKSLVLVVALLNIYTVNGQDVVTTAQEHFDKFNNVEGGWLAGDGTLSLLLPDGKTLWIFGDCIVGEKDGEWGVNTANSTIINNAVIIEDGDVLTTYHGGTTENPFSLIPGDGLDIFWPEHATIENDTIKIFTTKIIYEDNGTPGFNFRIGTTHIASYKYPEMEYINTVPVEYITDTMMRFGAHVLQRDDYTYIFGKKSISLNGFNYPIPMLARVTNSVSEPWEFYAGSDTWSFNCEEAIPVGDRPMSESFFVYEENDKFYLIMHEIWGVGELFILEADEITGPWDRASSGGIEKIFCIIPPYASNFHYNLFAHPHFQNDDRILFSFNVNTSDFEALFSDTRNYRARFYWLSVEDAMAAVVPDTVYIFEEDTSSIRIDWGKKETQYFEIYPNRILVKNINTPSVLSVYSIDGKMLYYRDIDDDLTLNLGNFPNTTLIIKLLNEKGVFTKKIIKTY